MKADEKFEKLGYLKRDDNTYVKNKNKNGLWDEMVTFDSELEIWDTNSKLTLELYDAIYEKLGELGWLII